MINIKIKKELSFLNFIELSNMKGNTFLIEFTPRLMNNTSLKIATRNHSKTQLGSKKERHSV